MKNNRQLLMVVTLLAWTGILTAGERDVVKPLIADQLVAERLTHQELTGSEIDRRITDLVYNNYMVLDLDRDWLDKFRHRSDRGDTGNVYYGIGKVLDAGSLFAQYTDDPKVAPKNAVHCRSNAGYPRSGWVRGILERRARQSPKRGQLDPA